MDIQHLIQLHRGGHNKGLGFQLSFSVNLASSVNNKLMVAPLEIVQAPTHRLG